MALIRFGVVRGFNEDTYLADVELEGYVHTYIHSIPVAFHVREDLLTDGTKCVVIFLDELNPSNAVLLALFSGRPADDPAFDPQQGHKHRGILRDGPILE
jgi:hypothetical protein